MFSVVVSCLAFAVATLAFIRAWLDHRAYLREYKKITDDLAQAERLIRYRGNLANEIAHEIKNPITAILCSAETLDLLLGRQLNEEHRKSLHYIREFGDSLLRLVSDFLDVSRAEAGKIVCRPQLVQVSSIVDAIIGLLQASALRKDIELKNITIDRLLSANLDPIHFKQVLFNLLYNAIKFTPRGGEIVINVKSSISDSFLEISVRDNGPGIPKQFLNSLFDPYSRYEHKPSDRDSSMGPGIGLGLALCKSLVELANGTIRAESQEGNGSTFIIDLPKAETKQTLLSSDFKLEGSNTLDQSILAGQKILILEQDSGTRDSVARLLEAWGGSVKQVGDEITAVNALSCGDYSSIIVNATLLNESSCELINMLSSRAEDRQCMVLCAQEENIEYNQGESLNRSFYKIQKPFSGERLLKALLDKS